MNFDKVIQNIIIIGLLIVAFHMLVNRKIVNEGFTQGQLIPSGHSQYVQEVEEQDLRNYIFNEASENDVLDKSFVFTTNVIQKEDPNLQKYDTTFRGEMVSNNQELQERIQKREAGDRTTSYQSYGDNMKVYDYPDQEQTDLTGGKFAGALMPYAEDEQNDYAML